MIIKTVEERDARVVILNVEIAKLETKLAFKTAKRDTLNDMVFPDPKD